MNQKNQEALMSVMEAIQARRAIRSYTPEAVDEKTVNELIEAAILAPTAMHQEPWAFVVIQDKSVLDRLSDRIKTLVREEFQKFDSPRAKHELELANDTTYNAFLNAGTLIVICGKGESPYLQADCWLAAENLMLAACGKGLGTCPIGFAIPALNTPEWRSELNIPIGTAPIAAIVLGEPAGEPRPRTRKKPEILSWKR